ncbi:alpha-mannosidase 2 [Schistocerca piceifrons]|uniref:alpha-mannosidase 2 n=1 Tax=Schistocerca piceifrons TaxID=274613 RepID=UPI001F5E875A|nr:alpha-mannosidase 2 [Schistocerca piceifrons]
MRIRKLTALVCAVLIFGGCMLLYLMMDVTLLPHEFQENKWIRIGDRLKELEDGLNRHHETVSKIRDSIKNLIQSNPQTPVMSENVQQLMNKDSDSGDYCAFEINEVPNTDVQLLDLYEKLPFDNVDGGAWKQGWNIVYDPTQWTESKKLKVFVVPHSHNDPGWIKTFEDYYQGQTRSILNNMVKKLGEDKRRKFIWAEVSFFQLWWNEITPDIQEEVKRLIENGQLEIVTGGWVMNDEANTHYFSMLGQMIDGHNWLEYNLNIKPNNSWSIDPFGHSPVMAYLLKKMGFSNLLIQRVHYSVKKHLARNKQLEFRWRQLWDHSGTTDLLTHMMPFYSYDVPHTCGPDPKVCCQFDFRRLPGYGISCPWKKPPQAITDQNVAQRAQLLFDQYMKKAQLFRTNVVIAPLGDDFRYDHASEWDVQFNNYQRLFDYMNQNKHYHVQAQFGTLQDYFKAVREESSFQNFPTLSGDFFTYADRDDHYWSGYYTSRPFYKRMDRVLVYYLRAAEIMFGLAWGSKKDSSDWPSTAHTQLITDARHSLSLFQHHDGITGTAKDHVVEDYAKKMHDAITGLQHVIQQSAHYLLSPQQETYQDDPQFTYFDLDDVRKHHYSLPEKTTLTFGDGHEYRKIVIFNSLTWKRRELITIRVSTPYVKVTHNNGSQIICQVTPTFLQNGNMIDSHYDVSFIADVPALSLVSYFINVLPSGTQLLSDSLSQIKLLNTPNNFLKVDGFENVQVFNDAHEFSIKNKFLSAAFGVDGLLKAITIRSSGITVPVSLDFARYLAREGKERSGAYLFLPDGAAETVRIVSPMIRIIEGPLFSQVDVVVPFVQHTVKVYNTPGADSFGIEIHNLVDITDQANYELVMRFSSGIQNGDEFFTDLNGLQVIRRKRLPRLPLQGNYYPMPSLAYIQDKKVRLTLLSSQPAGFASLKEGQIEVMQDRRLNQDDNRGLGQGVLDNKPTPSTYRIILEERQIPCQQSFDSYTGGFVSAAAHIALHTMANPLMRLLLVDSRPDNLESNFGLAQDTGYDIHLVKLHSFFPPSAAKVGVIFFRQHIDTCFNSPQLQGMQPSKGVVKLSSIFPSQFGDVMTESSLSFLHLRKTMPKQTPRPICPMELAAYVLPR